MSIQVANKSKRSFIVSGGNKILPGAVASLPDDEAKRLLALYPTELFDEGVTLDAVAVKAPEQPAELPAPAPNAEPKEENTDESPKRRGRPPKA